MQKTELINGLKSISAGISKLAEFQKKISDEASKTASIQVDPKENDPEKIKELSLEFSSKLAKLGLSGEDFIESNADHLTKGHVTALVDANAVLDTLLVEHGSKQATAPALGTVVERPTQSGTQSNKVYNRPRC